MTSYMKLMSQSVDCLMKNLTNLYTIWFIADLFKGPDGCRRRSIVLCLSHLL